MLNWYSSVSLVAMLLFCMLAAYVLTRSPRGPVPFIAVAAQCAAACFLLGQVMEANAPSVQDWVAWARPLEWSSAIAPALWYWLTVLLLREQGAPTRRYLRAFGYPLGVLTGVAATAVAVASFPDGLVFAWGAAGPLPSDQSTFFRFHAPTTDAYLWTVAVVVAATVGSIVNVGAGWRWSTVPERRRRFAWLTFSAAFLCVGSLTLAATTWLGLEHFWPVWLSHFAIAIAQTLMAVNVAAYSLFLSGRSIRQDFLYLLSALAVVCLLNGLVIVLAGPAWSFELLRLLVVSSALTIFVYALTDQGRRLLDRFFFADEVQLLRAGMADASRQAAVGVEVGSAIESARVGIEQAMALRFTRLTEECLRSLNRPAALARCGLISLLPRTLEARRLRLRSPAPETPLEDARLLRETMLEAIERLRPAERDRGASDAGALQYAILREEYVLGRPNAQIMTRHSIGEGTFNRNRREAIRALAEEMRRQEEAYDRVRPATTVSAARSRGVRVAMLALARILGRGANRRSLAEPSGDPSTAQAPPSASQLSALPGPVRRG